MSRISGDGSRLQLEFPAATGELPVVREQLRRWLSTVVAEPARSYDLLLAAGEACTNSVEHGHGGDRRPVRLDAVADETEVRITITDSGQWNAPRTTEVGQGEQPAGSDCRPVSLRGRGIALMQALVDDFRLTHTRAGTTVALAVGRTAVAAA